MRFRRRRGRFRRSFRRSFRRRRGLRLRIGHRM